MPDPRNPHLLDAPSMPSGDPAPPTRRRRWPRVLLIAVVVLGLAGFVGYRLLLGSPWGAFLTLFADDHRAENFRTMDTIFPAVDLPSGDDPWELADDQRPLPGTYRFEGEQRNLEELLTETQTTGLVVLHDGAITHERYRLGNDETSPATSWSMAKSVVSALVGIAIAEGHLDGVDDEVADYVPELAGSGYDGTTLEDLLTMSSGVDFDEGYDSWLADVNMIFVRSMGFDEPMLDYYAGLERIREPGTFNAYASSDTGVLAAVLTAATGEPLAGYASSRLWEPAGMEADAFWSTDRSGAEIGFCCLNARLRDYARFGQLYLDDGVRDGHRILPEGWVAASTTPSAPRLQPGDNPDSDWSFGYGYQWWIPEDPRPGEFTAIGVWGQYVYVDTTHRVVIARTATDPGFDERDHEMIAAFRAIVDELAAG